MPSDFQHHDLLFSVRRSVRYHNRRRMFFDRLHLLSSAVGVVFGSATIISLLSSFGTLYTVLSASVVTVFSTVDLVVGSAQMARLHADLARRFITLEKKIITAVCDQTELTKLVAERLDIEADEPPVLRVLDSLCHNELMRAMGYEKERFLTILWYQRLFAQIFDLREYRINR